MPGLGKKRRMYKHFGSLVLVLICPLALFSQNRSNPGPTDKPSSTNTITLRAVGQGVEIGEGIPPLSLPDGRLVVTAGDTIYMVERDGKLSWHFSWTEEINSQPAFRSDRNEIAIIGDGLTIVRLDAATGKKRWSTYGNGMAAYVDVQPYGQGYLVLVDMSGYREQSKDLGEKDIIPDKLEYWGEAESEYWSVDFPVGAKMAVAGIHIYAVKYQKTSVTLQEISPGAPKK